MGRKQGYEPSVLHSSIALLQERFRKLERVKEMREERELLRLFSKPDGQSPSSSALHEKPRWFFHPELVQPSMALRAPTPLRLEPHGGDRMKSEAFETPLTMGLWSNKATMDSFSKCEDVDTSLHL